MFRGLIVASAGPARHCCCKLNSQDSICLEMTSAPKCINISCPHNETLMVFRMGNKADSYFMREIVNVYFCKCTTTAMVCKLCGETFTGGLGYDYNNNLIITHIFLCRSGVRLTTDVLMPVVVGFCRIRYLDLLNIFRHHPQLVWFNFNYSDIGKKIAQSDEIVDLLSAAYPADRRSYNIKLMCMFMRLIEGEDFTCFMCGNVFDCIPTDELLRAHIQNNHASAWA